MHPNTVNILGERFGSLIPVAHIPSPSRWRCACDCGREAVVRAGNLASGNTRSCGHCKAGDTCIVTGCAQPRYQQRVYCVSHAMRMHRYGDPDHTPDTRVPVPAYRTLHARIASDRGRATQHPCTDCGSAALHWSYDYTDPSPLYSPAGTPYSVDIERYHPRCASCHYTFDRNHFD